MFKVIFCHTHCGILVLLSNLAIVVLYNVALYSKYFKAMFYHTHCGILVLLSIPVIVVLCNVALCSKYLKQCFPYTLWHTGIIVDSCHCDIMQCCIVL